MRRSCSATQMQPPAYGERIMTGPFPNDVISSNKCKHIASHGSEARASMRETHYAQ